MIVALSILLLCIFAMLIQVFTGKTLPLKLMSIACLTNYIIVLLCILSLLPGRDSFVDVAYIYGLLGFIVNLAATKLKKE